MRPDDRSPEPAPRADVALRRPALAFVGFVGCCGRLRLSGLTLGMARLKELATRPLRLCYRRHCWVSNNSAYSRWWEARTLWGQIVNNSRSFARQVCTTVRPAVEQENEQVKLVIRRLIYLQIAYVHALRQQLRGLPPWDELARVLEPQDIEQFRSEKNVPLAIQRRMGSLLRDARERQWVDPLEWQAIDRNLDDLADAQGGTERIKSTPMPKQYDYFPMLFVQIFCVLLPMGMVEQLGWITPLGSTVVGFMFLALDKIGRDLEDPFDNTIYDIPLTAITTNIEINLRQLLGEQEFPAPVAAVNGVLW